MSKEIEKQFTPIEIVTGIGAKNGKLLRAVGIDTLEILKSQGWQNAFERLVYAFPETLTLDVAVALLGAQHDCTGGALSCDLKREAKMMVKSLKRELVS